MEWLSGMDPKYVPRATLAQVTRGAHTTLFKGILSGRLLNVAV